MRPVAVTGTRLAVHGRRIGARAAAVGFCLSLVLGLTGCNSQSESTAANPASRPKVAPGPGGDADMVSAFSATRGQPGLVDLKFKIEKRPAVGEPVEIQVAFIPTVELERLFARFQVAEGLQIVSGAESEHFEHPARGAPVSHKITVTARTDGIFYVTAIVLADSDKESVARTFAIPLIAGEGLTEVPATPAAASVADPKRPPTRP